MNDYAEHHSYDHDLDDLPCEATLAAVRDAERRLERVRAARAEADEAARIAAIVDPAA